MVSDSSTIKLLDLVRVNPSFVLKLKADGSSNLLCAEVVPRNTGMYWVAGTTVLPGGQDLQSVFVLDSDSSAEQFGVYWYCQGEYFEHRDSPELARRLGLKPEEVFPYSWSYHVPVEGDAFSNEV